jgi:hypothetical protein
MSRLQKVKTRKLQLAGTGERLMISICRGVLQYAPTQLAVAVRLSPHGKIYFLQATLHLKIQKVLNMSINNLLDFLH